MQDCLIAWCYYTYDPIEAIKGHLFNTVQTLKCLTGKVASNMLVFWFVVVEEKLHYPKMKQQWP